MIPRLQALIELTENEKVREIFLRIANMKEENQEMALQVVEAIARNGGVK